MHRRRYLTGIGGLTPTIAGCARFTPDDGDRDDPDRPADSEDFDGVTHLPTEGWRHVDVVEYGADSTGDDDVSSVLSEIVDEEGGDDLLVCFPPGTYRMDEGFEHENFEDFGLFGFQATMEVSADFEGAGIYNDKVFALGPSGGFRGRNVYVGGFEFDFTELRDADGVEATALVTYGSGSVVFENLRTVNEPAEGRRMIELMAVDDCRGRIHDCVVEGAPGAGIYVSTGEDTAVKISNSVVIDCDDNGFYCSNGTGRVIIENVTAVDNDISNIRLGGTVRDSSVYVTDPELDDARGYWLRDGNCRVENCYGYNDADGSRAVLEVAPSARTVSVTGSRFGSDSDQWIATVNERGEDEEHAVTFRECTFFGEKGDASTEEAIHVARHDTNFVECGCELTGDVHPIRFDGEAENGRVIGGRYLSERPIAFTSGRGGVVRDADLVTNHPDGQLAIAIPDVVVENVSGTVSEGVRTVVNGVGDNGSSDPAVDGDWHDNGREGVMVTWTDPSADERRLSVYRNGEWHSWSVE